MLWLGRPNEEVSKEQKEEFIGSLVEFDDRFQNLYWYQAYFLAASGIAEFCDCSRVDAIVEQIVQWAFGYFDTTKQAWQSFYPLDKQAKTIIRETLHSKVITELSKLLHFCQNEQIRQKIAENNGLTSDERIIGEIAFTLIEFSPNHFEATEAAKRLINNSLNNTNDFCLVPPFLLKNIDFSAELEILRRSIFPKQQFAENLEEENLGNPEEILELINFINTVEDGNPQKNEAMSKLHKIVTGNLEAVTPVLELIKRSMYSNQETDRYTLLISLECLQRIGVGSPEIISVLFELMNSDLDYGIKLNALWVLIAVGAGNQDVFNFIMKLVHDENNWSIRLNALGSLKAILQANLFSSTVTNLKVYLQDSVCKNNRAVYVESYWTLWHCAQNMTYPDFYQAWHN